MIKYLLTVVALCVLGTSGKAVAEPTSQRLPEISGYTLEGERLSLPSDLTGLATLIVIVEEDPFAEDFGSWRELSSQLEGEVPAVFLVTMGDRQGLSRSIAAGRLRAEVQDREFRAKLVPVFQDGGELRSGLGIASSSRVSAVLVSGSGEVAWRARGPASAAAIEEIRMSLRAPLRQGQVEAERPATVIGAAALTIPDAIAPAAPTPTPTPTPTPAPSAPSVDERAVTPPKMPEIDGVTLAGLSVSMPNDLGKDGTRLTLVAHHAGHDVLVAALSEAERAGTDHTSEWYVLLFMGKTPRFGKAVAAGQLRAKIESPLWQARIMPVYMELSAFEQLARLELSVGTRSVVAKRDGALITLID